MVNIIIMKSLGFISNENGIVSFEEVRELNENEYNMYLTALNEIYEMDDRISLFHMVYINYLDFENYMRDICNNIGIYPYCHSKIKNYVNNLNCKFNNFLSSVRLLLDHFDRKLKYKYGKESDRCYLFKTKKAELYDSYFSYRFIYKLRNYVQHNNVAITNLDIEKNVDGVKLNISLNKDYLLRDYKWGDVKKDLENKEDLIEVFPLMEEMLDNLKELVRIIIKDELFEINQSVDFINNLIKEIDNSHAPIIFEYSENSCVLDDFPLDLMNFINYTFD